MCRLFADWLWHEWWQDAGDSPEAIHNAIAASVSLSGPPQTFVLLVDGELSEPPVWSVMTWTSGLI
jgi:hypothetical protein